MNRPEGLHCLHSIVGNGELLSLPLAMAEERKMY